MGGFLFNYLSRWFHSEIVAIPGRMIAFFFLIALFIVPLISTQPYLLRILIMANIFVIFAASWDLLAGYTGQFSLGHALFFGVSAYGAALLNINYGLPPWATIPFGALVATIAGLIIAIPVLRLRSIYLSLVTLAFPLILIGVVRAFPEFSGGELGIYGVAPLVHSRVLAYYIILLVMIACLLLMWKLTDAKSKIIRTGVIFHAIREDEITARASGINTIQYKFLAFSISGFFAGIAGGLYVHFVQVASPSTLELMISFYALLYTIFGGMMTIYGPVVGTYVLYPLTEFIRLQPGGDEIRMIVMVLILIVALLFMPGGVARWVRERIEVNCPRCKTVNMASRRSCRICTAPLHVER